jgi:hypothetical protein
MIKVRYSTIDGVSKSRTFKTVAGARKFAQHWIGRHPEIGYHYAVAGDGVGKITVSGATLADLFPADDQRSEDGDGARQGSEWS